MCRAIKEIKEEAYKKGFKAGYEKGYEKGFKEGLKAGLKNRIKQITLNLIRMNVLSYNEIATATQLPLIEVQALAAEVQK